MLFKKHKHVGGYIGSSIIPESSFISSSASGTYSSNEINVFKKRVTWPIFGEADTDFGSVVFLFAADGTNGSVILSDSSSYNHTIGIVGNAELSTDIKKFGSSSLYVFGGSANVSNLSSNDWNFNTNDFTIECWIYPTAGIGASRTILSKFTTLSSNLDFLLEIDSANGNLRFRGGNNAPISILSNSAVALNAWSHVAISRAYGVTRMFINGILQSSTSTGLFSISNVTTTLTIGKSSSNTNSFSGYIDEIRITKNISRYSSSFTPYNGRFSNFGTSSAATSSLLTIARNNGSSTFTGSGTYPNPWIRSLGLNLDDTDGLSRYSWTAIGTATVRISFGYSDDSDSSQSYQIKKNGTTVSSGTSDAISVSVPVVSGDIITITATGDASSQYFANVSVYTS